MLSSEINDPHMTSGYLAHDSTDFEFIGPDRLLWCIDTVDQYVAAAKNIQATWLSNYRAARIPVSSSLNISVWQDYLVEYLVCAQMCHSRSYIR